MSGQPSSARATYDQRDSALALGTRDRLSIHKKNVLVSGRKKSVIKKCLFESLTSSKIELNIALPSRSPDPCANKKRRAPCSGLDMAEEEGQCSEYSPLSVRS